MPVEKTVESGERILNGEADNIPESLFYFAGGLDVVIERHNNMNK